MRTSTKRGLLHAQFTKQGMIRDPEGYQILFPALSPGRRCRPGFGVSGSGPRLDIGVRSRVVGPSQLQGTGRDGRSGSGIPTGPVPPAKRPSSSRMSRSSGSSVPRSPPPPAVARPHGSSTETDHRPVLSRTFSSCGSVNSCGSNDASGRIRSIRRAPARRPIS